MQFTGQVIKKPFATGSKSARDAVLLATDAGDYVLRRQGGNPFHDETLEQLVGKRIVAQGVLTGYTLLLTSWKEAAEK